MCRSGSTPCPATEERFCDGDLDDEGDGDGDGDADGDLDDRSHCEVRFDLQQRCLPLVAPQLQVVPEPLKWKFVRKRHEKDN